MDQERYRHGCYVVEYLGPVNYLTVFACGNPNRESRSSRERRYHRSEHSPCDELPTRLAQFLDRDSPKPILCYIFPGESVYYACTRIFHRIASMPVGRSPLKTVE